MEESNISAEPGVNDVIEWYFAAPITIQDVPGLEAAIPRFADALNTWLDIVTCDPQ